MACMEKLNVMNSQMGLRPAMAAPTAMPAKPDSVMGVSITRDSPYFSHNPRETCLFVCLIVCSFVCPWLCVGVASEAMSAFEYDSSANTIHRRAPVDGRE